MGAGANAPNALQEDSNATYSLRHLEEAAPGAWHRVECRRPLPSKAHVVCGYHQPNSEQHICERQKIAEFQFESLK